MVYNLFPGNHLFQAALILRGHDHDRDILEGMNISPVILSIIFQLFLPNH